MKSPWAANLAWTAFIVLAPSLSVLGAADPVTLRYSPELPGRTNVYSVTLETRGESGREVMTGNLFLTTTAQSGNLIGLTVRGQLRPKPVPGQTFYGYRPGGPMSLSSLIMGPLPEYREIWIDSRGHVVRTAQDLNLPIPLGQLLSSLVEEFPADASSGWETEKNVFVLDDPMGLGPAPAFAATGYGFPVYYPGRGPQAALAARQKTKVEVTQADAETVTLERTMSLDTQVLAGTEPRISASGQAKVVRLRASGLPRSIEMQTKSLVVTENVSRRSELSLRWQMLTGAELEAALNPPPPPPANPFTADEVAQRLADLKKPEAFARQQAIRELNSPRLGRPSEEVIREMARLAQDPDEAVREGAVSILAVHGGREQVPLLIKALKMPGSANLRNTVAQALGRLKDPKAAEALTELLAEGSPEQLSFSGGRENAVSQALVSLGQPAEPAVVEVLKQQNLATRVLACNILKQIGTKKSLRPLKDLTGHPVKEVSEAAAEAARWIKSRGGE